MSQALVIDGVRPATLTFTADEQRLIRDTYANGASESEFKVLLAIAQTRNLNPLLREIFFVKRWDSDKGREVWQAQVSIDGFRSIAERTGLYDGQDEPELTYDEQGRLLSARVRVYRKDWGRPAVGVAYWGEFVQTKKDGGPTSMWLRMGRIMLAKCAEAQALRKAFPQQLSGLYTPEEMSQASRADEDAPSVVRSLPVAKPAPALTEGQLGTLGALCQAMFDAESLEQLRAVAQRIKVSGLPETQMAELRQAYAARKADFAPAEPPTPTPPPAVATPDHDSEALRKAYLIRLDGCSSVSGVHRISSEARERHEAGMISEDDLRTVHDAAKAVGARISHDMHHGEGRADALWTRRRLTSAGCSRGSLPLCAAAT